MNHAELERALDGFAECALWTASCNGMANHDDCRGEDCDASLRELGFADVGAFTAESIKVMREQIRAFIASAEEERPNVFDGMGPEQIGHDFSLTRDGHGTGFWDRGLGERGDYLTNLCKPYGEGYVHIGNDGVVYYHG